MLAAGASIEPSIPRRTFDIGWYKFFSSRESISLPVTVRFKLWHSEKLQETTGTIASGPLADGQGLGRPCGSSPFLLLISEKGARTTGINRDSLWIKTASASVPPFGSGSGKGLGRQRKFALLLSHYQVRRG